ncbi:MAG: glycoside hydrolase family 15 protein [Thermoanaerobaculia bacterium]
MPRDLPIGNGSLLVAFDAHYRLADFYFPHVGMENHAAGRFRFGVWADDDLSWIDEPAWTRKLDYLRDTLVTDVTCANEALGLRIRCYDAVDSDSNAYIRKVVVRNTRREARDVKLFFHHDLALSGNPIGDTAMFDPETGTIIHYKATRYLLVNCQVDSDTGVHEYECGRSGAGSSGPSWRDAEDGKLSMTAIAQGTVDSTIAVPLHVEGGGTATMYYWICAGDRYAAVRRLDEAVRSEGPAQILSRTASYWYTWVNKPGRDLRDLPDEIIDLYRRSLLTVATHCDREGGVLASCDSDVPAGHNDHYAYMWARDAAFVCDAMDRAGFTEITRRFLQFASHTIKDEGYFLHKYHPDGSVASLWHPWVRNGVPQLPIQEDETALVIWLVARHYDRTRDLDLLRQVYQRLVVAPAEFLVRYRDTETSLPLPSFDLWEERQGVFTFTCAAVWAGLTAAAELANLFNDQGRRAVYLETALQLRDAMVRHLWLEDEGRFARGLILGDSGLEIDKTVDSSAFAAFHLGVFPATSATVEATMKAIRETLRVPSAGGIARYENDSFQRSVGEGDETSGNPWVISTLWLAEHAIASARTPEDLQGALDLVRWARSTATSSMTLPEQVDPEGDPPLSVSPLAWSHAQVISVVDGYLANLRRLRLEALEQSATQHAAERRDSLR